MPFNDRTADHLARLQPYIAARAFALINGLRAAGVPAYISSSTRTVSQQASLVRRGTSRTMQSKHLDGRAFDIDVLGWSRDALPKAWWLAVGEYAESLGLNWGGRWQSFYDAGHFEI